MQLFYGHKDGNSAALTADESKHAIKVLRKSAGDIIHVMDGAGNLYSGPISNDHQKHCTIRIEEEVNDWNPVPYQFHLAIAPTKHMDRLEWLIEKAVEIGITRITPLLSFHSERKVLKLERLEKILLSACKQSLKGTLPQLDPLTKFTDFIVEKRPDLTYIGYCGEGEKKLLVSELMKNGPSACVIIGPEGDFSADEFSMATSAGVVPITLGDQRLRTETAGLTAVQAANLIHQLKSH
ncbi:MAG: 16S rRNA (uracil(1498)-N(3))-methyltransferase [Bacteroidetes bacterium]|nr:MAG: 16S rRNA (uracil(1498)-N(3))-methyltransferase [Bacteroidota bacterium]